MPPRSLAVVLALLAPALTACGSSTSHDGARTVVVRVGGAQVRAEVAADEAAREQGLSGRESLASDRGMLFVYPDRQTRTYWMKGMRFALDMIWIDRGRVTGVERDVPVPAGGDLPTYSSPGPADRVLEVRAGWAAGHGVGGGTRVVVGD